MENTQAANTTTTKTCGCGCGAPVSRTFLPGHDAKLKASLIAATKSSSWWIRESAVGQLIQRGWGMWIDAEILGNTPVRSKYAGRFVETRHFRNLQTYIVDAVGDNHSHKSCPAIVGGRDAATWSDTQTGWLCGVCIHTEELAELVASDASYVAAMKLSGLVGTTEDEEG